MTFLSMPEFFLKLDECRVLPLEMPEAVAMVPKGPFLQCFAYNSNKNVIDKIVVRMAITIAMLGRNGESRDLFGAGGGGGGGGGAISA